MYTMTKKQSIILTISLLLRTACADIALRAGVLASAYARESHMYVVKIGSSHKVLYSQNFKNHKFRHFAEIFRRISSR